MKAKPAKSLHKEISAAEFRAKCLKLMDEVQQQRREITITKRGKPVARLAPLAFEMPELFGRMKGTPIDV